MTIYKGACHCGSIKFQVDTKIESFKMCDCSFCKKKNAVMLSVHKDDFKLLEGEADLALYQWNMKIAKHHFCKKCGIYTFHHTRSKPGIMGVNANCLVDVDVSQFPINRVHGSEFSSKPKDGN